MLVEKWTVISLTSDGTGTRRWKKLEVIMSDECAKRGRYFIRSGALGGFASLREGLDCVITHMCCEACAVGTMCSVDAMFEVYLRIFRWEVVRQEVCVYS